jgi:hypothetical protein
MGKILLATNQEVEEQKKKFAFLEYGRVTENVCRMFF